MILVSRGECFCIYIYIYIYTHTQTPLWLSRFLCVQARWEGHHGESLEQLIRQKYSYVVSCQLYGTHKRNRDPKAADTEFLLQRFPNLRVAYVDKTSTLSKVRP